MTEQKKANWQRSKDPEVEALALRFERICDHFISIPDYKLVRRAEQLWLAAYGNAEKMQAVIDTITGKTEPEA